MALTDLGRHSRAPLKPHCSSAPPSVNLPCPLLRVCAQGGLPPPDNESMPSRGWFLPCGMRQCHKPLPDSLWLEQTLSDSLSLSFQDLFPRPHHPPFLPPSPKPPPPGESAELGRGRDRPRPCALVSAHKGAPGMSQDTAFKYQTGTVTQSGREQDRQRPWATQQILAISRQTRVRCVLVK